MHSAGGIRTAIMTLSLLVFILGPGCISEKKDDQKSLVGNFALELTVEKWFNSKPLSLRKDLLGKVILLEFGYPTPKTVNQFMQYKGMYAHQGFEIISFVNRSDKRIQGFINGMMLDYIVVRDDDGIEGEGDGRCGKTWKAYGVPQSVDPDFKNEATEASYKGPTAFLIGRSGKVRWEGQVGKMKEDMLKKILKERPQAVLKKIAQYLKKGEDAVSSKSYQTAIKYFQKVIVEANGTEYASSARKEIDRIKELADAQMKEVKTLEKEGKKPEAVEAYRKIATDFKGLVIAKEALGLARKLEVEVQENKERKP